MPILFHFGHKIIKDCDGFSFAMTLRLLGNHIHTVIKINQSIFSNVADKKAQMSDSYLQYCIRYYQVSSLLLHCTGHKKSFSGIFKLNKNQQDSNYKSNESNYRGAK